MRLLKPLPLYGGGVWGGADPQNTTSQATNFLRTYLVITTALRSRSETAPPDRCRDRSSIAVVAHRAKPSPVPELQSAYAPADGRHRLNNSLIVMSYHAVGSSHQFSNP